MSTSYTRHCTSIQPAAAGVPRTRCALSMVLRATSHAHTYGTGTWVGSEHAQFCHREPQCGNSTMLRTKWCRIWMSCASEAQAFA